MFDEKLLQDIKLSGCYLETYSSFFYNPSPFSTLLLACGPGANMGTTYEPDGYTLEQGTWGTDADYETGSGGISGDGYVEFVALQASVHQISADVCC